MEEVKKNTEIKESYLKEIYLNVLKAIIIVLYFFILNLAYENIKIEYLLIGTKIFTMIFLFISIYIFEKAYKNDDDKLAIQGIEILVLSAYTLTTEHITNKFDFNFKSYSLVASYIFAIYLILRCIVIYTKGRKKMVAELSDIREIVEKKEPIKKEATKKEEKENIENKANANKKVSSENKANANKKKSDENKINVNKKKSDESKTSSSKSNPKEKNREKKIKKEVTKND